MDIINLLDKVIVDGQEINLQSLTLLNGILNVGSQKDVNVEYIFKDNTTIPANIFKNLNQLKYAYFPKAGNIKIIGEHAFENSNLTYINNLTDVNYIGAQALSYTKLTYVYDGDAPDSIAANAWSYINTLDNDFKNTLLRKYPYIDFGDTGENTGGDDGEQPVIVVISDIINVTNNSGEYEISYRIVNPVANVNITASTNVNWISDFNYNTSGKIKFNVSAQANNAQQRSASITLTYGTITKTVTIIQAAGSEVIINNPIINVSQTIINSNYTGGEYEINYIITNPTQGGSIIASTTANWITDFDYSISGKIKFNISAQANNSQQRTATIILSYPNANDVIITIIQEANNTVINNPVINISENVISGAYTGGEYTINYTITNPIQGSLISATSSVNWINNFNYNTTDTVTFNVDPQEVNGQERTGIIVLSYPNATDVIISFIQAANNIGIDNPVINVSQQTINGESTGGTYVINYTISNPISGASISASTSSNWINTFDYSTTDKILFNVDAQIADSSERTATIILSYPNANDVFITFIQAANNIVVSSPVINISSTNLTCENEGGQYIINYSIENPIQGSSISATSTANWISNFKYNTSNKIIFNVEAQETNASERTTTIVLSYPNAEDVTITFTQLAWVANGGGPEPTDKNGWYRVESTDWLNIGDKIIISSTDENYAMSTVQNNNNRGSVEITKSSDDSYRTCTISDDVQQFILESGNVTDTYALKCINGTQVGKYIYAASNSSNHIKSQATLNDNGSFLISFESNYNANVVAQGTNSNNIIKFNSTSKLFSCYGSDSSMGTVIVYKYYTTDVSANPIINVTSDTINVTNNGGEYEIDYTISNPINSIEINATTNVDWITNIDKSVSNKISFTVAAQEENIPERTATITLSYPNATDVTITVIQAAGEVNGGGPEPTNKNGWYRVESADWLNVGDKIVIASANTNYALSTTQNDNNRGVVEITKTSDDVYRTCTISNDVQQFILEAGTVSNTYALKCIVGGSEIGNYIYAASNSSNHIKSQATLNDNGSFLISFESNYNANIIAQGTNSHNTIKYFENASSQIFSCYTSDSSTANPVIIYKYYTTDANSHPVITVTSNIINATNTSGEYEIDYSISNTINGVVINATTDVDWITNINTSTSNKILFTVAAQDINTSERTATITLSYTGASSVTVTIIQAAGEVVSTDPAITVNENLFEVPGTGGLYSITYTIANANGVDTLTATCADNWVNNINVQSNLVSFNVDAQDFNTSDRTTIITLSYPGAENVTITITQSVNMVQPLEIIANLPTINGVEFGWRENNALNVFTKETNSNDNYTGNHKFIITENNLIANRFTIDGQNIFDPNTNYDLHISYPYNENILDDPNTTAYINIGAYSSTSSVTQNGYNNTNHLKNQNCPLYGSINNVPGYNDVTINMNYLLSIIKIRVTNTSDKQIIIKNISVTAPEDIIGSYTVDYFSSTPIFTPQDPTLISNTATLKVKDGTILANDGTEYAEFYIAVKPFTLLTTDSLTITVNGYSKTITPQADIVFDSGIINSFDFDYDIVVNLNEPSNVTGWYRVEKEEWLQPGDKVIIVANTDDYAMSATQGSNNRSGVAITKSTDGDYKTCTIDSTVQEFIVTAGNINNTIAFKCINGNESNNYIYAASSGNNYLKSTNTLSNDASFTFELDHQGNANLVAQGENTRNHLQYYKTSTLHTFSCYSGDNLDVAIYKYYSVAVVNNPSINISAATMNVPNTAGNNTINYTISDPISGALISASTLADWITNFDYSTSNKVIFTVTGQETNALERTATITLSYPNANDVTITVTQAAGEVNGGGGEPTGKNGWYRVESTDWLNVGDTVIIAAKDEDYAMSTTQNTNNRGVAEIYNRTMDGAYEICSPSSSVQQFELVAGTINDTFAFKFLDDNSQINYIYAASNNSSGYLRSYQDNELDAKGSFNITFESDYTANIVSNCTSTRNTIRYYKSGDNRAFNCYVSGQKPVLIYKKYQ